MQKTIELTKEKIQEVIETFDKKEIAKGYAKVSEVAGYLLDLNQKIVEALGNGRLLEYNMNHFMEILNDLMSALTEKDSVLISDILQYDMLEELERLEKCL